MDPKVFRDPPARYRGVTLWMLNDRLETDRLIEQLDGFHAAGWGAVIGRTFNGLLTEYLSDEWMDKIEAIIRRCGDHGMRTWLQAGYMPSAMPDLPPEDQYRGLVLLGPDEPIGDGEVLAEDARGRYVMRQMDTIVDLLDGRAVSDYLDKAYKQSWHLRFAEHFGKTIEAVWVDEPHFRPQVMVWSRRLPERFERSWGYDIRKHIPELFHEQGDFHKVRHHYWRTAVEMFMDGYFKPVADWCADHDVKFAGHLMGEDTLNNQVAWTGATMPAYEYMQLPGIDHLTLSLNWPTGKKFILTPKQATSVANQMNIEEMLAEVYAVSSHRLTFAERKRIADWMAVLGINYRCIHGSFYSMRGRRKRIYVPHLSDQQPWWDHNREVSDYCARQGYVLRQGRRRADVLVLHPQESIFCIYDPLAQTNWHNRKQEKREAVELDTALVNLCDTLLGLQRDFEFGDETLLAKYGSVNETALLVKDMPYRVVVLPNLLTIRATTLKLLLAFIDAGGAVLAAGHLPVLVDGLAGDQQSAETAELLAALRSRVRPVAPKADPLRKALDAVCEPVFTVSGRHPSLWTHLRLVDDGQLLLLVNTSDSEPVEAEVSFNTSGRLEHWNLDSGEIEPVAQRPCGTGVATPLALEPQATKLLLLRTGETPVEMPHIVERVVETVKLTSAPRVERLSPNALTLDFATWSKDGRTWSDPTPIVMIQHALEAEDYHGPLRLRYSFEADSVPDRIAAVIEVPDSYAIAINGTSVDYSGEGWYVDRSFKPIDISGHVGMGVNTLELSTEFHPVPKAGFALAELYEAHEGTELEAIYLIGDFAVTASCRAAAAPDRCLLLSQPRLAAEKATCGWNATADGYGFFVGRLKLSDTATLRKPGDGERAVLKFADLHAPLAIIHVNSRRAGVIKWNPLELDISDDLIDGDNEICVELVSSLRNLLGPHHRDCGEPDDCWRTAWDDNRSRESFEHAGEQVGWTDDWYSIHFGTTAPPMVEYRKKQ